MRMPISETLSRELKSFCEGMELPVEFCSMPPAFMYSSAELADVERRAVFSRSWQPLARVEQLPGPGHYVSGCFAGIPWVITRDHQGRLRAFVNICRHKGREVVRGSGQGEHLVCGYHAWSYDLEGRLKKAPQMAGAKGFERDAMRLLPMQVEVWGPWVFVNADIEALPLAPKLKELNSRLHASGWETLKYIQRAEWIIECNWKVYVDNYLDGGYHVPHMHPSLSEQLDMPSYTTELYGEYSIQSCLGARRGGAERAIDPRERIGERAIYAWMYPNFMLNRYGPCLDTNHVIPLSPTRCKVVYEFYFQETEGESAEAFIAKSIEESAAIQREDIEICESVQLGLNSGMYSPGRYAPRVEHGEHHFHGLLARALRSVLR